MKNLKIGFTAVVFCLGFTGFSNAQPGQKTPPTFAEILEKLDENEDGKLAESEVKGPLKDQFATIDTDEDGFISEEEFNNAPKPERRSR